MPGTDRGAEDTQGTKHCTSCPSGTHISADGRQTVHDQQHDSQLSFLSGNGQCYGKGKESGAEEVGVTAQEQREARQWTLKRRMDGGRGGQGKAVSGSGVGLGRGGGQ